LIPSTGQGFSILDQIQIYPANLFVTTPDRLNAAILQIQQDLFLRLDQLYQEGRKLEIKRLKERTEFDIEMMKELGYCSGIENYSCYMDNRLPGMRPLSVCWIIFLRRLCNGDR